MIEAGVIKASGSNCDEEMRFGLELAGVKTQIVLLRDLMEGVTNIRRFKILGFPGGFADGDAVRAGIIQANRVSVYLGDQLHDFINHSGVVIGVCNGFQVLVNAGLLPSGQVNAPIEVALTKNQVGHFKCEWRDLKVEKASRCVFLESMPSHVQYQIAHGEGRFIARDHAVLDIIETNKQVAFRYANPDDTVATEYPFNPNGSENAIAGLCDPTGRILGLMPHPERFITRYHHPNWRRDYGPKIPHGLPLFEGMVRFARES